MALATKPAATKASGGFRCTECGWTTAKWIGRCGECQQWGTVAEIGSQTGITRTVTPLSLSGGRVAKPIAQVSFSSAEHVPTGIAEFDRVLGGGIVPGAAILLSGEPGVGKSTLLLDVANRAAQSGSRVLYLTAEESAGQVRLRAERTGALADTLYLAAETDLAAALGQIDAIHPDLVVVDSVQTFSSAEATGIAGGTGQVREVASALVQTAKSRECAMLIVGHVTKDGTIAGPRTLEHLVDVVCQFDGDQQTALRFVRAAKNRFGPVDEVGCFEMTNAGIAEVPDPSGLFLSRVTAPVSGTCITIAREGRRVLPVEIQALTVASSAAMPRRVTHGVDSARVAMLLAVLERRAGIRFSDKDVYVSTVGGVKLSEPAADLAIAIALASAVTGETTGGQTAAFGEISLAGGVRPAPLAEQRTHEAGRLGYTHIIDAQAQTLTRALSMTQPAPGF